MKEESRPTDRIALSKHKRDSAVALHAIAESHTMDNDNTHVLQRGFRTHSERLYTEALQISFHSIYINRNDWIEISSI